MKKFRITSIILAVVFLMVMVSALFVSCDVDKNKDVIELSDGVKIKYNKNAKNIVALSGVGDLAMFGIKPKAIIADKSVIEKEEYKDYFDGVELLENTTPFSSEEIIKYKPDLILVYDTMDEKDVNKLSKIAPVIPLYRNEFDFSKRLGHIGKIFGKEEKAKELIEYANKIKEENIAKIKELNLYQKEVSVFYYFDAISIPPTEYWYYNKIIYDYLGMKRKPIAEQFLAEAKTPFDPISKEKLKDYEGDIVIFADLFGIGLPEDLKKDPAWNSLQAVKENRVGILDASLYAEKDVLFLKKQYEGIFEAFKKAIKK